jgi:hypothetical protein
MGGPNRDCWLLAAGLAYPVITFGVLLGCGGALGPLAFHPLAVPLPAALLATTAIGLRLGGARLRWSAVVAFVGWLAAVVWLQWLAYASAAAAV